MSNTLFGWDGTKTSMQMVYSAASLPNLNMGQLQACVALGELLSLLAAMGLSLAVSSACTNPAASLAAACAACLLPVLAGIVLQGEAGLWLRCLLPAGGVEPGGGYLYALAGFSFLSWGSVSVWTPRAMLAASAVEIPVLLGMTLRAYSRRAA